MQPGPARADGRTVIRVLAIVAAAAFLLSGCSSEEGTRAQELLQQAEQAQAKLTSATFEAKLGFAIDRKRVDVAMTGAVSKEGSAFRSSPSSSSRSDSGSSKCQSFHHDRPCLIRAPRLSLTYRSGASAVAARLSAAAAPS